MSTSLARPGLLALALLSLLPIAAGAQELDDARRQADRIEERLETTTARFEEVKAAVAAAGEELAALERQADDLAAEAAALEQRLGLRARRAFMLGSPTSFASLLDAEGSQDAVERAGFVAAIQHREAAGLEEAIAVRTALGQTRALAEERRAQLEALEAELAELTAALEIDLGAARDRVRALETRAARQRRIDRGGQRGVYACPMDPGITHFIDSWGFPRSGGRTHKGVDMFAAYGMPLYAVADGTVTRVWNNRLGGLSIDLIDDRGDRYYYAHLSAAVATAGQRVRAGDVIGANGDSGNARGTPPHLHWQYHPGNGPPVNPYPLARALCRGA